VMLGCSAWKSLANCCICGESPTHDEKVIVTGSVGSAGTIGETVAPGDELEVSELPPPMQAVITTADKTLRIATDRVLRHRSLRIPPPPFACPTEQPPRGVVGQTDLRDQASSGSGPVVKTAAGAGPTGRLVLDRVPRPRVEQVPAPSIRHELDDVARHDRPGHPGDPHVRTVEPGGDRAAALSVGVFRE
jgi:hypothetical protein